MRKEYVLEGSGRPNPYAKRLGIAGRKKLMDQFLASEHLVRLDEEIAKAFPSDEAVNEALRLVLKLREATPQPPKKAANGEKRRRAQSK